MDRATPKGSSSSRASDPSRSRERAPRGAPSPGKLARRQRLRAAQADRGAASSARSCAARFPEPGVLAHRKGCSPNTEISVNSLPPGTSSPSCDTQRATGHACRRSWTFRPRDLDGTAIRFRLASDQAKQRRFPRAACTQDRDKLAARNLEASALQQLSSSRRQNSTPRSSTRIFRCGFISAVILL